MSRLGSIAAYLALSAICTVGFTHAGQPGAPGDIQVSTQAQSSARTAPRAVFPELSYSFGEVFEGNEVKHDFVVENQGNAPLVVKNIRPD